MADDALSPEKILRMGHSAPFILPAANDRYGTRFPAERLADRSQRAAENALDRFAPIRCRHDGEMRTFTSAGAPFTAMDGEGERDPARHA